MKGTARLAGLVVAAAMATQTLSASAAETAKEPAPKIQMAILLDTSGSMEGLINQARTQLWRIVNEFATMKRGGRTPVLEVALYEYGKSSIPASEGYLRMICPLTTDLDKISEELFALRTNGGSEYCGMVIQAATNGLAWSAATNDLKTIFIAGNEPFSQGSVDYRKACKAAIAKGIVVNTIHCGDRVTGEKTGWKEGATLADGKAMNIDQNQQVAHIAAPQDAQIVKLNAALNATYVPYGTEGAKSKDRQSKMDLAAEAAAPAAAVQRTVAKAGAQYRAGGWDLVDACIQGKVKLEDVKEADLPPAMRKMALAERKAYVAAQAKKRAEIQAQIQTLNEARKKHVAAERKKLATAGADTLGSAVVKTVREQAAKKNFTRTK